MDLQSYVKRATDGSVDKTATIAQFSADLDSFVSESEVETTNIANAVNGVFDQYKGERITLPTLCMFASQKMNAQPSNAQSLNDKIAAYVRSNTVDFNIAKGKNGGVARVRDLPAKSE